MTEKIVSKSSTEDYLNRSAVLEYISNHSEEYITYSELASATMVPKMSMTTLINQLLKDGNIARVNFSKWWGTKYKVLNKEAVKPQEAKEEVKTMAKSTRKKRANSEFMKNVDNSAVEYIKQHNKVTYEKLAKGLGVSISTSHRVVKRLVEAGLITRGSTSNGVVVLRIQKAEQPAPVKVEKKVFQTLKLADKTRKVHFSVLDENGVQVIDITGNASDSRILSIMSELAGVK